MIFRSNTDNQKKNSSFIIRTLAECSEGDHLVFICDSKCRANAEVLADNARDFGMVPIIVDIDAFGRGERYLKMPPLRALKAAVQAADCSFMLTDQMLTDFGLFFGNSDETDTSLLGKDKRFTLEANGMEQWVVNEEEILHYRERTIRLQKLLAGGGLLHVTTRRGTDFTCDLKEGVEASYPVMAIIPFYAEVAVIPRHGYLNGVIVVDGASQCAYAQRGFPIRPCFPGHNEIHMEPLRITFKNGLVESFDGPDIQVERLKKWMYSSSPNAVFADEIGIVTTTSEENDRFGWLIDGTHQSHCIHVAIGNNTRRGEIIHAPEHCDFDMHDPIIKLDGETLYENRKFNDDLIFKH